MRGLLCGFCGFAEMMGLGAVLSLPLPGPVVALILLLPVLLLFLVLALPAWQDAARARRAQVYVYVPPEQRRYPGQVTRPYVEQEVYQSYEEEW